MTEDQPTSCGRRNHGRKMGMDWAHTPENRHEHHQTGTHRERKVWLRNTFFFIFLWLPLYLFRGTFHSLLMCSLKSMFKNSVSLYYFSEFLRCVYLSVVFDPDLNCCLEGCEMLAEDTANGCRCVFVLKWGRRSLLSGEAAVGCQRSLSWRDVHKATHYFVRKSLDR